MIKLWAGLLLLMMGSCRASTGTDDPTTFSIFSCECANTATVEATTAAGVPLPQSPGKKKSR